MEKGNESMRERLLARLPQMENREIYREETAALMARYERALFWERVTATTIAWMGMGVFLFANSVWARPRLDSHGTILLDALAVVLFFAGALMLLGYSISRSKVDVLKEVKQVQLQVLELQASLRKDAAGQ
jgi:hypothetical protein